MELSDQILIRVVLRPRKVARLVQYLRLGGPQRQVWTFWRSKTVFPPPGTKHRFAQTKTDPLSPTGASRVITQSQFCSTSSAGHKAYLRPSNHNNKETFLREFVLVLAAPETTATCSGVPQLATVLAAPNLIHNLQNPSHSAALFLPHLTATVGSRFSGNVPFRRSTWNAKMAAIKLRY